MARSIRLIVPIAIFLIFQGVYAIDIYFSASCGGESVGTTDSYDVAESVGVGGTSSASFDGGVSITDSKSLSGSCDAKINQIMFGSGGGADYVINYALETIGASSIEGSGSSTLTPVEGSASRYVSMTGTSQTTSQLWGSQGDDFAGVLSSGELADFTTAQRGATGQSVAASQKTVIEGDYAYAFCEAYNTGEDFYAYVDNRIDGNAYLNFEGEAAVNDAEARAHQRSYAEGDDTWPWMNTTHLGFNGFRMTGSYNVESWATATESYELLMMFARSV